MGGRGGSSGISEPQGRQMSIKRFLDNLAKNNREQMLDVIEKSNLQVGKATFTVNGNAVESQEAVLEYGENKISIRFYNRWEPTQVTKPTKPIKQTIEVVTYKNGNATALRILEEKKSSSLKNAEKNYREMLERWKKLTKQRRIGF